MSAVQPTWRVPERAPSFFSAWTLGLAFALLAMAGARLFWAGRHGWNADEGLVAEIADSLARGKTAQAGALYENGFAPLTAPSLPLTGAALLRLLLPGDALMAARLGA